MGKKKVVDEGEGPSAPAAEVIDSLVFVNREKLTRAKDILELVSGKRAPRTTGEEEQKDRFSTHFANHEMGAKDKNALRFVYETLLGGLVRSEEEQVEADEKAAKVRAKSKKDPIGERSGK